MPGQNKISETPLSLDLIVFLLTSGAKEKFGKNASERKAYIRSVLGPPQDGSGAYSAATLAALIAPLFCGDSKTEQTEKLRKLTADADLAQSKAHLASLALRKAKGELYEAAAIKEYIRGLAAEVKANVGGLGSALALQLAAVTEPREIQKIIEEKTNKILMEISKNYGEKYKLKNKKENDESESGEGDDEG